MYFQKLARRGLAVVAVGLTLGVATTAQAGHGYRDVLVVPTAAPVVYGAPIVVQSAPIIVQSAPVVVERTHIVEAAPVVVERTRIVQAAPVVVRTVPAVVASPVPTAYVLPRAGLLAPRPRVVVSEAPVFVPSSRVIVLPAW